ncbi:MAG TPA: helix-turn-helix transcriptional regulator [Dongiaceae bacterium]|nr:helix-turn-helix transcriptional regulator [Dongiaceae bacterium]
MMLNNALRLVRQFHRLSVTEVAERLNVSKSYISEIERDRKNVTIDLLQKYSDAFNIPASSLMLFAEKSGNPDFPENTRVFVADKVIKMLDWIAATQADDDEGNERNGKFHN